MKCPICLLSGPSLVYQALVCGHVFCSGCVATLNNSESPACPLCRIPIGGQHEIRRLFVEDHDGELAHIVERRLKQHDSWDAVAQQPELIRWMNNIITDVQSYLCLPVLMGDVDTFVARWDDMGDRFHFEKEEPWDATAHIRIRESIGRALVFVHSRRPEWIHRVLWDPENANFALKSVLDSVGTDTTTEVDLVRATPALHTILDLGIVSGDILLYGINFMYPIKDSASVVARFMQEMLQILKKPTAMLN